MRLHGIITLKMTKNTSIFCARIYFILGIFCLLSIPFATVRAAQTPPLIFTYQGRLTNSGGNLLGGSGTVYNFKFSIYDSSTGGNLVWPVNGPTATSTIVRQGVFTVNIGDTTNQYPDALNLDFSSHTNLYLQVEVLNTSTSNYEALLPRQQITSAAFAQVSGAVIGTTTPSLFGTTTQATNSFVTIAATSSASTPLTIVGFANQVTNLFRIASSSGESIFVVANNGNTGVGTPAPNRKFDIFDANSVPQLRLSNSSSAYGEFKVDSSGDIHVSSPGGGYGGNVRMDTQNLFVCAGDSCGVDTASAAGGNLIVETAMVFGNKFKLEQTGVSTTIMYDTSNNPILEFDDGQ